MKPVKVVTWFSIVLAVLLLFTIAAVGLALVEADKANKHVCMQANVIQAELRGVVIRQSKGLGANVYFKQHPDELKAAKRQIADELKTFGPLRC